MTQIEYAKYKEDMARKRRINNLVLATLKRAKDAGIPETHQRIGKEEFTKMLCPSYRNANGNINNISDMIYDNPDDVLNKFQFIFIDGGDKLARKRAGFALLFRLIATERNGKFELSETFIHTIEDYSGGANITRNEYLEEMSLYDILFISDFDIKKINRRKEASSYFDEVFGIRENNRRLTIISFEEPIGSSVIEVAKDQGRYFHDFYKSEKQQQMKNALRIRVKI